MSFHILLFSVLLSTYDRCVCASLHMTAASAVLQNALLDGTPERPLLKICDFGYSKNEHMDSAPKSLSGTPDYLAPEVTPCSSCPVLEFNSIGYYSMLGQRQRFMPKF